MAGLDPVDKQVLSHHCLNEGDQGFVCSRPAGHDGAHCAANTISGFVYDTWANHDAPSL